MTRLFTTCAAVRARDRFTHFFIACAAVTAVTIPTPAFAAPIISVVPAATTVLVGDVFTLEFSIGAGDPSDIDDVFDLYAYQFGVAFNPLILSATSVSNGSFLTSGGFFDFFIPGTIDNAVGLISFNGNTLLAAPAGVSGSGSLLSVEFMAIQAGTSLVSAVFDPDPVVGDGLFDGNFLAITDFSTVDGSVTVQRVAPEPATLLSVGLGLSMVAAVRRRRRG